jgi:hypothetical protein
VNKSICQSEKNLKTSFNISTHFRTNYYFSNSNKNNQVYSYSSTKQIGISSIIVLLVNKKYLTYGMYELSYIIPKKTMLFDSIKANQRGFNFSANILGYDLFSKREKIDLVVSLGVNCGRVWLKGDEFITQKNGFFAPKVELFPRINFGKFCFYSLFQMGYDITNPNWKRKGFSDVELLNLTNYKNHEYSLSFGIGYLI